MTTERRWYDPPAPRDWHPTPAELERLQSNSSLRKALLNRSSSRNIDRVSLRSSCSAKSDAYSVDKSYLERSIRGSISSRNSYTGSPLVPPLRKGTSTDGSVRTLKSRGENFSSQASSSAGGSTASIGSTYAFNRLNTRGKEDIDRHLRTSPPSRVQSSRIAKYQPLPAISTATTTTDSSNNKETGFEPPPLIRSRTFDVIDTKMKNLPEADDYSGSRVTSPNCETPTHTVTVSIEGKPLAEFLLHARDGLLKSRPGTRYGRPEPGEVLDSGNSELQPDGNSEFMKLLGASLQECQLGNDSGISEEEENSEQEGNDKNKVIFVDCSSHKVTDNNSDWTEPSDNLTQESSESKVNEEESSLQEKLDNSGEFTEGVDSPVQEEDNESSPIDKPELCDKRDNELTESSGQQGDAIKEEPEAGEDIIVYFKLPDDSLMLVSSPRNQTLGELLQVVGNTRVGDKRLVVAQDSLDQTDLTKTLVELGITDNTTLYLLNE
ncbi:uncharacterized protein [Cherax quadricarinatus]|uniref:uncharacterized protein n=1 Tax=Cherax quadricarinatus TaxID=27406 RepID=UPI00237874D3|nr:uncharacterized protein LOC128706660 [Cherax quadricarinatus]